jgi:hydrogenase maturation factor
LHAKYDRQFANLESLGCALGRISAFFTMVCGICVEVLDSRIAVKTASQGCSGGGGGSRSAQLTLLVLKLHVETQVGHWVVGVCGFAAFVAHDAAAKFTIEGLVEEALALGSIAL